MSDYVAEPYVSINVEVRDMQQGDILTKCSMFPTLTSFYEERADEQWRATHKLISKAFSTSSSALLFLPASSPPSHDPPHILEGVAQLACSHRAAERIRAHRDVLLHVGYFCLAMRHCPEHEHSGSILGQCVDPLADVDEFASLGHSDPANEQRRIRRARWKQDSIARGERGGWKQRWRGIEERSRKIGRMRERERGLRTFELLSASELRLDSSPLLAMLRAH
eukprot:647500-Hanusia_phi.AAC.2